MKGISEASGHTYIADFEKLRTLLKEWGQFELVQDAKSADIVINISTQLQNRTVQMPNVGGMSSGMTTVQVPVSYLRILDTRDGTLLWSDETTGDSKDPRQLVDKLKRRMKKK